MTDKVETSDFLTDRLEELTKAIADTQRVMSEAQSVLDDLHIEHVAVSSALKAYTGGKVVAVEPAITEINEPIMKSALKVPTKVKSRVFKGEINKPRTSKSWTKELADERDFIQEAIREVALKNGGEVTQTMVKDYLGKEKYSSVEKGWDMSDAFHELYHTGELRRTDPLRKINRAIVWEWTLYTPTSEMAKDFQEATALK